MEDINFFCPVRAEQASSIRFLLYRLSNCCFQVRVKLVYGFCRDNESVALLVKLRREGLNSSYFISLI